MLFRHIAAAFAAVLCSCHIIAAPYDRELARLFSKYIEDTLHSSAVPNHIPHCLGNLAAFHTREHFCEEEENAVKQGLKEVHKNSTLHQSILAAVVVKEYTNYLPMLDVPNGYITPSLSCLDSDVLQRIFCECVTTNSLRYAHGTNVRFLPDAISSLPSTAPASIIDHVLNVVSEMPTYSLKSTGFFAANVFEWYLFQHHANRAAAGIVLARLISVAGKTLVTQQTALKAIYSINRFFHLADKTAQRFLIDVIHCLGPNCKALRYLVPSYNWLLRDEELSRSILPKQSTVKYQKRRRVEFGLLNMSSLSLRQVLNNDYNFELQNVLAEGELGLREAPNIHLRDAVRALLKAEWDGATSVATRIIVLLSQRKHVPHAAEILRHVVEHGQAVDLQVKTDGYTTLQRLAMLAQNGVRLPPCNPANQELYFIILAAESVIDMHKAIYDLARVTLRRPPLS